MNKVQTLLVVWQDENSRSYYHIGTLSNYNGLYEFSYTSMSRRKELGDAINSGYMIHPVFPDTTKIYQSKKLFPSFDRRIPSDTREDFDDILGDLGLSKNASRMDILRATRGRLASDTYSFEQPLKIEESHIVRSNFFVHGMRHQELPIEWSTWIKEDSSLYLKQEPENKHDPYAVGVYTRAGKQLGYIPTFYSNAVFSLLENGLSPTIRVTNVNERSQPHWWVQVAFECKISKEQKLDTEELFAVI